MTASRGEYYQDYVDNFAAEVEEKLIAKKMLQQFMM